MLERLPLKITTEKQLFDASVFSVNQYTNGFFGRLMQAHTDLQTEELGFQFCQKANFPVVLDALLFPTEFQTEPLDT